MWMVEVCMRELRRCYGDKEKPEEVLGEQEWENWGALLIVSSEQTF